MTMSPFQSFTKSDLELEFDQTFTRAELENEKTISRSKDGLVTTQFFASFELSFISRSRIGLEFFWVFRRFMLGQLQPRSRSLLQGLQSNSSPTLDLDQLQSKSSTSVTLVKVQTSLVTTYIFALTLQLVKALVKSRCRETQIWTKDTQTDTSKVSKQSIADRS